MKKYKILKAKIVRGPFCAGGSTSSGGFNGTATK